ncbi:MAG: hypothetical protein J0H37_08045, partial [Hyphomicrobium denitrificans]|nr:hypothetical protein [Hyphomicrobium denitrificans]
MTPIGAPKPSPSFFERPSSRSRTFFNIDVLITQLSGLQRQDLERWILNEWVRPDKGAGTFVFREIDVARVKLIQELRDDMEINEAAMPVV